jgi:hypothetical protein
LDNSVTVNEAIKKGHRMVTYPGMAILLGPVAICLYLGAIDRIPLWMLLTGIGAGVVLAWLYWSIMITKWRVWAFENVRNVHELKKRATREKLIWGDNNIFEKTEIRNAADRENIDALQAKFKRADVFEDDLDVPEETLIYYAKGFNILQMFPGALCGAGGIYMLATTERYWVGIGGLAIGLVIIFENLRQVFNKKPQIILNNKGMQTISTPFYKWSSIRNEEVIDKMNKNVRFYLKYDHPSGEEELPIDDYTTNRNKLEHLMYIYRGRSKKTKA